MWAAQGHGAMGGIHTPVCPHVCTVLLTSAVYSATTLCCLLFRGHRGQEDQYIIQWIREETNARKGIIDMSHGKCWSCLLSLQIWRYPGMSCYHLMLWFSADDLCLLHQSMAVLSLLWKWMYTSRIRDVVTWVIHPLPGGWPHDWHGEIAGWYGKITDMLNDPLADRHCFTNCGVETTGKKRSLWKVTR